MKRSLIFIIRTCPWLFVENNTMTLRDGDTNENFSLYVSGM